MYRAELVGPGGFSKTVAIKALHSDYSTSSQLARRLRDEARLLGLVRHPAIVRVDSLVQLRKRWTIVMEYVDGLTLRQLVEQQPDGVPPSVAWAIVRSVAEALDHAWRTPGPAGAPLHLLHRDIKPSNLKITPLGEVKILDFGLARADTVREADSARQLFVSVPYMAPERLEGRATARSDVYSLGAVLYELLVGEALGRAYGNPKRHAELLDERLAVLGERHGADVAAFVASMLAYDDEDRPSMTAVEETCARTLRGATGPELRVWSREHVPMEPPALDVLGEDSLLGKTLQETLSPEDCAIELETLRPEVLRDVLSRATPRPPPQSVPPPPLEPAGPQRMHVLVAVGVGALTGGVLALGVMFARMLVG